MLLGVSLVVFFMVRAIPGDPAQIMLGQQATQAQVAQVRENMGLDKPIFVQYGLFLKDALRGDLGSSTVTGRPVTVELPRSPLRASLRKSPYWTKIGLSRPMFSLTCATCAWVACWPSMIWAGSPGMARTMKNTTRDTPSSTGIICKILRPMYSASV